MEEQTRRYASLTPIEAMLLAAVTLLGAGLRIYGITFGLPNLSNYYIRPDETLLVVPALKIFSNWGDPELFHYPALLMLLQGAVIKSLYFLRSIFCDVNAGSSITDFFWHTKYYWGGIRALSAIFAAATIPLVYLISRCSNGFKSSAWAALIMAVWVIPVRDAHFAVTDSLLAMLCSLCLLLLLRFLASPNTRRAIAIGVAFGAALAAKYSAILILPALLCGLCFSRAPIKIILMRLAALLLTAALTFALINPYLLMHLGDLLRQGTAISSAIYGKEGGISIGHTLRLLTFGPADLYILVLALGGIGIIALQRNFRGILAGAAFLGFLTPVTLSTHIAFRYTLPILPFEAVLSAYAIEWLLTRKAGTISTVVHLFLAVGCLTEIRASLALVTKLHRTDTRSLAWEWIATNIPTSTPILLLGTPEGEIQILETPESIERRMDYVSKFYGKEAGNVISEIYKMNLSSGFPEAHRSQGFEVYRRWLPNDFFPDKVLAVAPYYPFEFAKFSKSLLDQLMQTYQIEKEKDFFPGPISAEDLTALKLELDETDAFYLPIVDSEKIERPGPGLRLILLQKNG